MIPSLSWCKHWHHMTRKDMFHLVSVILIWQKNNVIDNAVSVLWMLALVLTASHDQRAMLHLVSVVFTWWTKWCHWWFFLCTVIFLLFIIIIFSMPISPEIHIFNYCNIWPISTGPMDLFSCPAHRLPCLYLLWVHSILVWMFSNNIQVLRCSKLALNREDFLCDI